MNFHSKNFSEDYIICPYCEFKHTDVMNSLPELDSDLKCIKCDKDFTVYKHTGVGYETFEYVDDEVTEKKCHVRCKQCGEKETIYTEQKPYHICDCCRSFLKSILEQKDEPVCVDPIHKNEALLVWTLDWEGLYINGKLVEEGHTLNEGKSRIKYFVNLAKQYNFDLEDMKEDYLNGMDQQMIEENGSMPVYLSGFHDKYGLED